MKSTFKILFYIKRSKVTADGKCPVMCRVTVNGTQSAFSCKLNVHPQIWDDREKKRRSDALKAIDDHVGNIEAQIRKHYQKICDREAYVTAAKVVKAYQGFGDEYKTLIEAFDYHLKTIKSRIGKDRKLRTYEKLQGERKCLVKFLKDKYTEDIALRELDLKFIQQFHVWLQAAGNYGKTTAFDRVQTLKCILYVALENGWISNHPFLAFKCKPDYKPRGFLSDRDIQKLMNVELRYHRQRAVRDMFLFCCFTGLSYIDLRNLTYNDIFTDTDGKKCILARREKTGTQYHIQLLPIAEELIERYRGYRGKVDENHVFPVKDGDSMTVTIGRVAAKCGLNVKPTMHIGRHTFATTVTLEKGVPIETVSEMLGHKHITTTQIYAKMTGNKMKEDMDRLADRLEGKFTLPKPISA